MTGINVECNSSMSAETPDSYITAEAVRSWLEGIPNGAHIHAQMRDFGSQRDPEPRLTGLRATWSEVRHTPTGLPDAGDPA